MKTVKRIGFGLIFFVLTMAVCLTVLIGCEGFGAKVRTAADDAHYVSDPSPSAVNPATQPSSASLLDEVRQIVQTIAPNVPYGNTVLAVVGAVSALVGAVGGTVVTSKTTTASQQSKYGALITELVGGIQTYADSNLPWSAQLTAELTKLGLHDAATTSPNPVAKPAAV